MTGWELPREAVIGGNTYHLHTDYRDILDIFSRLQDEALPEFIRWRVALALFYEEQIPEDMSIKSASMDLIEKVLRKHGGNRKAAAAELGISERTLYRKLKQMNL